MEPNKIDEMIQNGFEVVDLTCLDVKKVQQKAIELSKEDYLVLILGKPSHPEVVAINANAKMYSDKVYVVANLDELKQLSEIIKQNKKVGVVIQTTQKLEFLQEIVNYLIPVCAELKVFNTICKSTSRRQQEAKELAKTSDLMIVVGGKNSSNSLELFKNMSSICPSIFIEDVNDYESAIIDAGITLSKNTKIGITAGASTNKAELETLKNLIENKLSKL